jgi:hypothetical protein
MAKDACFDSPALLRRPGKEDVCVPSGIARLGDPVVKRQALVRLGLARRLRAKTAAVMSVSGGSRGDQP